MGRPVDTRGPDRESARSIQRATLAAICMALAFSACGPAGIYTRLMYEEDGGTSADRAPSEVGGTIKGSGGSIASNGGTEGDLDGSGGVVGSGGAIGTGSGGVTASGGRVGTGGAIGAGGTIGTGGRGTGGASSGGVGATGTGGATTVGSGGTPGTGGAVGTGGTPGTGGMGTGGAVSTGGSASGGSAGPTIISIDFSGAQTAMSATDVAGAKAVAHWNNAPAKSGSLTMLTADDGAATSAAVSWSAYSVYSIPWTETTGDTRMMKGYLDPYTAAAPATVTVTSLPSAFSAAYDVYVYTYGPLDGGTRASTYTIGSKSVTISQTGASASKFTTYMLAPAGGSGNYVLFRGVTGTSFTLTAAPGAATDTSTRSPVNGIQIVAPSGS